MDSIISSAHHYYIAFFQAKDLKSTTHVVQLFNNVVEKSAIIGSKVIHLKIHLDIALGSEQLLVNNRISVDGGKIAFAYDLYIGSIETPEGSIHFICYPYAKLSTYISKAIIARHPDAKYSKPMVPEVLTHMRNRKKKGLSGFEKMGYSVDIIKYSADVNEEANANTVSLTGVNPLDSKIYEVLNSDNRISIEPIALKLKCESAFEGVIELAFDRLGNYRFWLKRDTQQSTIPMIPHVYRFLNEIRAINKSNYITAKTLLEDE